VKGRGVPDPLPVSVRMARADDADIIAINNLAMALETEGRRLDPVKGRLGVAALLSDRSLGFYLVAESEGRVVGQCMVTYEWSDWRNGTYWWVQSVYVRPGARRRGVLSRLFESLMAQARKTEGVVGVRLYVDGSNASAKEAYSRLGLVHSHYEMWEADFAATGGKKD
jgi:GNAT superfamily N-acetyltransferase